MKSIASKLWLGMIFLVSIVLMLLWLFQIVFLEQFYTDAQISEVKKAGQTILQEYNGLQRSELEVKFEELANNSNLSIELLDVAGNSIYAAGSMGSQMPMMWNSGRLEAFREVISGKEVSLPMTHPRFNSKFILIGLPVIVSGKIQQALLITIPMAPVSETANILKQQLIYITGLLLVIAICISFVLSRLLTKPILEINRVSAELAKGNLAARIQLKNQDEIGMLAATINYLGQELSKVEQLRKDLVANVSHELRTPLSLIRGYAETIRDVSGDIPEKREKQLAIILAETERLNKIVNDILNLSQIQAGYVTLDRKPFLVYQVLERIVKSFEIYATEAQVEVSMINQGDIMVEADELRLEQVIYNLINNAINHTPPGNKVIVKALNQDAKIRVEVADTGQGIPTEDLKHIWERFYKADKTGSRTNSGSGLGLAIVKSILEAHNFDYGVDSEVGKGTTFWFVINN